MDKIRHSLSLKLGFIVILLAIVVFVASLGVMFVQSRYMLRKEATERVTSLLDNTVLRVSSYMNAVETATNSNGWMAQEFLNPDSLLTFSLCFRGWGLSRHIPFVKAIPS